jgi:flagellar biosynthesis component FlhA
MAFFAIAAAVVGTGMSMYGQKQASQAEARMMRQQNEYQNETEKMQAEWNRDQLQKQANYEETVAQKNMRRERENNKRELARRRASAARGGLMETGAVSDNLIEASERHQTEIDDIWEKVSTASQQRREQANMAMWEAATSKAGRDWQTSASISALKQSTTTAMWGTAIKGAGAVYKAGDGKLWNEE